MLFVFGACHLGKSILWASEDFLTLYTLLVVLKAPAVTAGGLFFFSTLWNAVFDGVWGRLLAASPRLRQFMPTVAAVSIPVACASFAFLPFAGESALRLAVALAVLRTSFTLFDVTHNAMASWLVRDVGHLKIGRLRTLCSGGASLAVGLACIPLLAATAGGGTIARVLLPGLGAAAVLLMAPMPWLFAQMKGEGYPEPSTRSSNGAVWRFSLLQMVGCAAIAMVGKGLLHVKAISLLAGLGPCLMLAVRLAGAWLWSPVAQRLPTAKALSLAYGLAALSILLLPLLLAAGSWLSLIAFGSFGLTVGAIALVVWIRFSEICAETRSAQESLSSYGLFTGLSKAGLAMSGAMTAAWLGASGQVVGMEPNRLWPLVLAGFATCFAIAALEWPYVLAKLWRGPLPATPGLPRMPPAS